MMNVKYSDKNAIINRRMTIKLLKYIHTNSPLIDLMSFSWQHRCN